MVMSRIVNEPVKMDYNWNNKTILVVEDVDLNYMLIKKFLHKTGANLIWAKNGQEAVDICQQNNSIDLVLMDIRMPTMNGFESTKLIKAMMPDMPILAQTAYALDGDAEKSLEAGCNDYIAKPINLKLFLELIARYIDR